MPYLAPVRFVLLLSLLAMAALWPAAADAQVRRCAGADGSTIFTDRRCQDIGAIERLPRDAGRSAGNRLYRSTCSRNLQDLVYELTTAIDSQDVNRLAGVYHWVGMSNRSGYAVMARLDAIVKRPLVDIIPVLPGNPEDDYYPQTTVRRAPVALRLEQTLANGSTPSRTIFGLRRYFDCWWVSL